MLILDRDQTVECLSRLDIVEVIRNALLKQAAGLVTLPPESYLRWATTTGEHARSIAMHAAIDGSCPLAGVKIINANPSNVDRGLARASGLTLIFDRQSGAIIGVMPSEDISAARTAAVSALAVDFCRSESAQSLALIGCGPVGQWHLRLLLGRQRYRTVALFDLRPDRALSLAVECESLGCVPIVSPTAQMAIEAADVVVAATTVTTPYVRREWLQDGVTVLNVSLDDLGEDVLLGADELFVDDWDLIVADEHRLLGRLARAGRIAGPIENSSGPGHVTGTIAELASGQVCGRVAERDVVVVNPFGMASSDIALGAEIIQVMQESRATTQADAI